MTKTIEVPMCLTMCFNVGCWKHLATKDPFNQEEKLETDKIPDDCEFLTDIITDDNIPITGRRIV